MNNFEPLDTEHEDFAMSYVINIEDATGREFYIGESGKPVALDAEQGEKPLVFKNAELAAKRQIVLEKEYPATCIVFPVERKEFEVRRNKLKRPPVE